MTDNPTARLFAGLTRAAIAAGEQMRPVMRQITEWATTASKQDARHPASGGSLPTRAPEPDSIPALISPRAYSNDDGQTWQESRP